VRDFLDAAFGILELDWKEHVELAPRYLRPTEVDVLCGDSRKAKEALKWEPKVRFAELVRIMVEADLELAHAEAHAATRAAPSHR
jgi:GDPmannose 4,6-dehydratase